MSKNPFTTKSSQIIYQNNWLKLREDQITRANGEAGVYAVVETNDSVMIVAENEKQKICLIRAFNYPVQKWQWELPGGGSDNEPPLVAAARELKEETNLQASSLTIIGHSRVCNGLMTEFMNTVLARDLHGETKIRIEEAEIIDQVAFFSLAEIEAMIVRGEIDDGQTLAALYFYQLYLNKK